MNELSVVYIVSLGRSGSTLLDLMLDRHSSIESVGEIAFFDQWIENNLLCSCGSPIEECNYWKQVASYLPDREPFRIGRLSKLERTKSLLVRPNRQEAVAYSLPTYHLFRAILQHTSKSVIVDSSKRVQRLVYLLQSGLFDMRVIHLVRNGKAVVNSYKKAVARPGFGSEEMTKPMTALHTSTRWLVHNLRAQVLGKRLGPQRYIRVRYEDLATQRESEMQRICLRFGIPYEEALTAPTTRNIHNICGSRWRFSNQDVVKIELDESWKSGLPQLDRMIFTLIAGLLNRGFGYVDD